MSPRTISAIASGGIEVSSRFGSVAIFAEASDETDPLLRSSWEYKQWAPITYRVNDNILLPHV